MKNKAAPAKNTPLTNDLDGTEAQKEFSYSSVVGMLLYLAKHSWADIAHVINCFAWYMFNPKCSREEALKCIGW